MSDECKWLHEQLEGLPLFRFPFNLDSLPDNGIYFFYEKGEAWGHGDSRPRVVRVGTTRQGNFRSRIKEHFLFDESKMNFDSSRPAPRERSIFRKNIGRALLNRDGDGYLKVWEIDFTSKGNRDEFGSLRDIPKERGIESEITRILRGNFFFRFIIMEGQEERMGAQGLESSLIGTLGDCNLCGHSENWLGNHSPNEKIRKSGLWLVQHLNSPKITESGMGIIIEAIGKTKKFIG
jgi:hypothetical protein